MKKTAILILSFACILSAAIFAACDNGEGNSSSSGAQETCQHDFADGTYACTDRVCLNCGTKVKATENHAYKAVTNIAPKCKENGYTLNQCDCGATMKNNTVAALGHDFGEYTETVTASCKTVGVKTAECSRCDEKDNIYVESLSHTLTIVETIEESCTENGYTKYHCSGCNEDIYSEYVRAVGHTSDVISEKTVPASCEQDGYEEYKCSVCNEMYYENVISATGHDWTETDCSRCGMDIKALLLTEKDGNGIIVKYTDGKGWKVIAPDKNDYDFAISKEELEKGIASGAKKLTLIFGGAFDGVDYGNGNPVNCKLWVIPKNVNGEDVWNYDVRWISGFTDNGDGTYSVEINLTNESYLFEEGIYFHVSNQDVGGVYIGACYIHDIIFS